jgi:hypothetical protein
MTRGEIKEAMSDLYAYAFADGRKSAKTVRDEDAGDHCSLGFEHWFEYVYAPIRLTPTLTLDPATQTRIGVDMARNAAKNHDLWKLIEAYADAAVNYKSEIDHGTSKTAEVTAKHEWIRLRDTVRLHIDLEPEEILPLYPNSESVVDRSYHKNNN